MCEKPRALNSRRHLSIASKLRHILAARLCYDVLTTHLYSDKSTRKSRKWTLFDNLSQDSSIVLYLTESKLFV